MKLEYIREYLTLTEEMNFTVAAEKRYLTQPALSRHIAALEESLGARLLDRSTHSVSLTPAGELAKNQFQKIIGDYDTLLKNIALMNHGYDNELRIGSLGSMVEQYIEPALEQLRPTFPLSKMSLIVREGNELIQELMDDKLDICLFLRVRFPNDEQIRFHKIGKSRLMVMALEQDSLCTEKSVSVRQLRDRTFIYPKSCCNYIDITNGMLVSHGIYPKNIILSEQEQTIRYIMKNTKGISLVCEHFQMEGIRSVKFLPFSDEDLSLDICWAYKITNANPLIPLLIQIAVQESEASPARLNIPPPG